MKFLLDWKLCALGLVALLPLEALAVPITFTHKAASVVVSGTLDGDPFSTASFTITATGDTGNRTAIGGGFSIEHDIASIFIPGEGTFDFITPTRTFVNNSIDLIGFSRASGSDLYNGPTDAVFGSYDLLTSIGPITGTGNLLQWGLSAIETSGGILLFDDFSTQVVFRAVTDGAVPVPEPGPLALVGFGLLALCFARHRRNA